MLDLVEWLGDYSVELSVILSCWLLAWTPWLPLYFAGLFCSQGLNHALKTEMAGGPTMPSGHFQQLIYSFTFVAFASGRAWVLLAFALLASACLYNCLTYRYHTPVEMVAGSAVGVVLGSAAAAATI